MHELLFNVSTANENLSHTHACMCDISLDQVVGAVLAMPLDSDMWTSWTELLYFMVFKHGFETCKMIKLVC